MAKEETKKVNNESHVISAVIRSQHTSSDDLSRFSYVLHDLPEEKCSEVVLSMLICFSK